MKLFRTEKLNSNKAAWTQSPFLALLFALLLLCGSYAESQAIALSCPSLISKTQLSKLDQLESSMRSLAQERKDLEYRILDRAHLHFPRDVLEKLDLIFKEDRKNFQEVYDLVKQVHPGLSEKAAKKASSAIRYRAMRPYMALMLAYYIDSVEGRKPYLNIREQVFFTKIVRLFFVERALRQARSQMKMGDASGILDEALAFLNQLDRMYYTADVPYETHSNILNTSNIIGHYIHEYEVLLNMNGLSFS